MFLFNSRTKKIIRWIWGFFAILIILSMIVVYSGFVQLATTQDQQQAEIPDEVLEQLAQQRNASTSPELEELMRQLSASGTVNIATPTIERTSTTPPPVTETPKEPVPQLKFGL